MGKDPDQLRSEIAETRERMGDTADALAYKADVPHRMQDAMTNGVDHVKSAITGTVGQARRAAARAAESLPDTDEMQTRATRAMRAIRENPLGLFFGVAAVGFVAGWLIPVTPLENRRLTPMVDQLKTRARDQVRETIVAVRDAALDSITT